MVTVCKYICVLYVDINKFAIVAAHNGPFKKNNAQVPGCCLFFVFAPRLAGGENWEELLESPNTSPKLCGIVTFLLWLNSPPVHRVKVEVILN